MGIDRRKLLTVGVGAVVFGAPTGSPAQAEISTPPVGDARRSAILDVVRRRVEADIGPSVVFNVSVLRVSGDWAFVQATPKRPGGIDVDWKKTRFRDVFEKDFMSDIVMGLLRHDGGRWNLVEYVLGPTDVFWENWLQKHRLPRDLFLTE